MATYYHGTTQRGLDALLSGSGKLPGPWNCADQDRMTYMWDADAMMNGEEYEDHEGVIRQAFESAQIQAAIAADDTTLYVLELSFPEDAVEPDYSCKNMAYAVTIHESSMTRQAITKAYSCAFSKWDAPFVLSLIIGNDYFAASNVADERLVILAEALSKQDAWREDLLDFDWETVELA